MTSGLEKTASRAAPANTQHRASSTGRSIKIQSSAGLPVERDSLRPSSRQLLHLIARQAAFGALSASMAAFTESGVTGLGGCDPVPLITVTTRPAGTHNQVALCIGHPPRHGCVIARRRPHLLAPAAASPGDRVVVGRGVGGRNARAGGRRPRYADPGR